MTEVYGSTNERHLVSSYTPYDEVLAMFMRLLKAWVDPVLVADAAGT